MPHIHIVRDHSREDLLVEIEKRSHEQERLQRELDSARARISNIQIFGLAVSLLSCIGGLLWFVDMGLGYLVSLCAGPWSLALLLDMIAEGRARRNL
jgi:hypothetical protein